ncbi:MAG TPA: condensation domain-containing protein, partial [Thermoanaerobaculia bacterium]|nr:condensation domain-containing protein [Thermoanaerobaculia bacterium]
GGAARRGESKVDPLLIDRFRGLIAPGVHGRSPRKPRAAFILSPPSSGSTLLGAMLARHPSLFVPPVELLGFETLRELKEALGDSAVPNRILVDSTSSYALDLAVLQRAEEYFEEPLYIHLLRHPGGMIDSFAEAGLDQVFFQGQHEFTGRQLAELTWAVSHQNILDFLGRVPAERQCAVRFEELVRQPREALEEICRLAGLSFQPAMLGDGRSPVDAGVAHAWRERVDEASLGEVTRTLAQALGYGFGEEPAPHPEPSGTAPAARTAEMPVPLSFSQQRLWFFEQWAPGTATYNMPLAIRLQGRLHRRALEAGVSEVARRHATLRTTFVAVDGEPAQVIGEPRPVVLPLVDLADLPAERRSSETTRLAHEEAQQPFDLVRGPLFRVTLLALGECDHVVLTTMHHIITDGWSTGVLVRELGAVYAALVQGRRPGLPPLPAQYADYVAWERTRLTGEVLDGQLAWWRQRLAGAPEVMNLPLDRPWPARRSFQGAHLPVRLGAGLSERLAALGRRHGA